MASRCRHDVRIRPRRTTCRAPAPAAGPAVRSAGAAYGAASQTAKVVIQDLRIDIVDGGDAGDRRTHFQHATAPNRSVIASRLAASHSPGNDSPIRSRPNSAHKPRARGAERIPVRSAIGHDERVGEHVPNRAGLDAAPMRRGQRAALTVPIGKEIATRRMLHDWCPAWREAGQVCPAPTQISRACLLAVTLCRLHAVA